MVNNEGNTHHAAPDKGSQNGPVWAVSGSFENYMAKLRANQTAGRVGNSTLHRRDAGYWLKELGPKGVVGAPSILGDWYTSANIGSNHLSIPQRTNFGAVSPITALSETASMTIRKLSTRRSKTEIVAAKTAETPSLREPSSTSRSVAPFAENKQHAC